MELPVLILLRNNLHLTKRCLKSVLAQDIPVHIWMMDNASTDGTPQWAATQKSVVYTYHSDQMSVAAAWNLGLRTLFRDFESVLVLNNDTEILPQTARLLGGDGGLFVTAVGVRRLPDSVDDPDPAKKRNHPDFSAYLIRREAWEKVGPFDESFKIAFAEDGDYDLRLYKAGIRAYCLDLPFLHHGSMTIKNAEPKEMKRIQIQADLNRKYFEKKWGFPMASEAYYRALDKGGPPSETEG